MSDAPIRPMDFLHGVTVVDIGDLRVARGLSRRPASSCNHPKLLYDTRERRIWCPDCEQNIEGFDAFELIVNQFSRAQDALRRRENTVKEAETVHLVSLAAKALDKAWRRRSMVPSCPQCHGGLFPEDFKNGVGSSLGREYAMALRKKSGKPVPMAALAAEEQKG